MRCYKKDGDKKGIAVAGDLTYETNLNELNYPTHLLIDAQSTLYVSDRFNHRVIAWMKGAKEGIVVAGGSKQNGNQTQLSDP